MQKNKNKKTTMFYFDSTREIKVRISRALSYSYTRILTTRFHTRKMGRKKKEKKIVPERFPKTKDEFLCWRGHETEQRVRRSTLRYIGMKFVEDMIIYKETPIKSTEKATKTNMSI